MFVAAAAYISLEVLALYEADVWRVSLAKSTCLWAGGTALVLVVNSSKAQEDPAYLGQILLRSLRYTAVIEFIVGLYPFKLLVEMVLVPLFATLGGLSAVARTKKEYASLKATIDSILAVLGIALIAWTLYAIIRDYHGFASPDSVRRFLLPPLLTLAFLPFMYVLALYGAYDALFLRVDMSSKDDRELARYARRKIFAACALSLGRVNRFAKENYGALMDFNDKSDVLAMVQRSRKRDH